MLHYALLVVDGYTGQEKDTQAALDGFEGMIAKLAPTSEKTKRLGPHSMLFDRENDLGSLGKAIAGAEGQHLKYRVLFFQQEA